MLSEAVEILVAASRSCLFSHPTSNNHLPTTNDDAERV
jgi:hypothetical protein